MRLAYKLMLILALPALIILAVGRYVAKVGNDTMRRSIESAAAVEVRRVLNEIDRLIINRSSNWQAYTRSEQVQEALAASNLAFSALSDIEAELAKRDAEWISADPSLSTVLLGELTGSRLALDPKRPLGKLEEVTGCGVFLTNACGANVAQTRRTSGYRQDDEVWWSVAGFQKSRGIHQGLGSACIRGRE